MRRAKRRQPRTNPLLTGKKSRTSVVFLKFLENRLGTVSGSTGVGLEPVGTGTKRFRQAPIVGNPTRRGRGGGPQATGLLTTGGRPAPVEHPNVKKR